MQQRGTNVVQEQLNNVQWQVLYICSTPLMCLLPALKARSCIHEGGGYEGLEDNLRDLSDGLANCIPRQKKDATNDHF
jgi:hypothetical protein